jgi:nitrate/nitrite-specific signal transduction histidine kinase
MKTVRNVLCIIWLVGTAVLTNAQNTVELLPGNAVNISGKQRMLSQRMGKDFVFISLNLQAEQAQREMMASTIIFEENLAALKAFARTDQMKELIKIEEETWREYKKLLQTTPSKENAINVVKYSGVILKVCDDVVQDIVKYVAILPKMSEDEGTTNLEVANNTNISGRMRMLSQRLSMLYAAFYGDLPDPTLIPNLKGVSENLQRGLSTLITSSINTTEIDDAMAGVIQEWNVVEERCTQDNCLMYEAKSMQPDEMFTVANRFLNKVDKVVGMYAKLIDRTN